MKKKWFGAGVESDSEMHVTDGHCPQPSSVCAPGRCRCWTNLLPPVLEVYKAAVGITMAVPSLQVLPSCLEPEDFSPEAGEEEVEERGVGGG